MSDIFTQLEQCMPKNELDTSAELFQDKSVKHWEAVCQWFLDNVTVYVPWFFVLVAKEFGQLEHPMTKQVLTEIADLRLRQSDYAVIDPRVWVGQLKTENRLPKILNDVLVDRILRLKPRHVQFHGRVECQLPENYQKEFVLKMIQNGVPVDHNSNCDVD